MFWGSVRERFPPSTADDSTTERLRLYCHASHGSIVPIKQIEYGFGYII